MENKVPNASDFVLKSDYATEISTIKNDYATNASLDSKINDLKAQHITDEVKKVDEKVKKNASDILGFEGRLKQKEYVVDEAQRENSFNGGFYYYCLEESYLVYKCKQYFFRSSSGNRITSWRASGIKNLSTNSDLKAIPKEQGLLPIAEDNGRMNVEFNDNYFVQNKVLHPSNNTVVNIYIVYRFDETSNTRNTDYTIQNALFGAVKITKNAADTSKNKYEGYGVCFDEGGKFSIKDINDARNVIIFGVEMSFSTHATNKANNIYVLGKDFVQGINGTTIYAEQIFKTQLINTQLITHATNKANNIYVLGKDFVQGINGTTIYAEQIFKTNFTEPEKIFVLSLHYNGHESYLFANGVQQLKFRADDSQILKEKLCLGNLSSNWTTSNSTKTGLYGKVYDFVVDYESINGVKPIYDMHRYLMTKHKI